MGDGKSWLSATWVLGSITALRAVITGPQMCMIMMSDIPQPRDLHADMEVFSRG